jgi:pimeloyl-ACP methyl ester carboxylesterase
VTSVAERLPWRPAGRLTTVAVLAATVATVPVLPARAAPPAPPAPEPDTAVLAPAALAAQKPDWKPCVFPDLDKDEADLFAKVPGLRCTSITVPLDWHNARDGRTMQVRVSRTTTAGASRQGIALVNPGGPGESGLVWGAAMAIRAPELAAQYDFVGFDPRGTGESTKAPCRVATPPAGKEPTAEEEARRFVEGCRANPLTRYVTTEQTAYDMDFIRVLLGEKKISYIGYSYGTWLGTWYAGTFPARVHRMLLDSAADTSRPSLERTWDLQPRSRDRAFQEQLLPYVARHDATYQLGTDPIDIRRRWEEKGGTRHPIIMLVTALFIAPALNDTSVYPIAAAAVAEVVTGLPAEPGDDPAAGVNALTDRLLTRIGDTPKNRAYLERARQKSLTAIKENTKPVPYGTKAGPATTEVDAPFELIRCQDGQWNRDPQYWAAWKKDLERNAPFFAPLTALPVCAYWPTANAMPQPVRNTFPKVMVVQSEMDSATAYEAGLATAKHLPDARLISVDNEGSHGVFPYLTTCVDDPVIAYFLTGRRPAERFTACAGKPLPEETSTHQVGGHVTSSGSIKIRMVTDDVRRANEIVRELLSEQATDPLTGGPQTNLS